MPVVYIVVEKQFILKERNRNDHKLVSCSFWFVSWFSLFSILFFSFDCLLFCLWVIFLANVFSICCFAWWFCSFWFPYLFCSLVFSCFLLGHLVFHCSLIFTYLLLLLVDFYFFHYLHYLFIGLVVVSLIFEICFSSFDNLNWLFICFWFVCFKVQVFASHNPLYSCD
jgi:hypothetical protein